MKIAEEVEQICVKLEDLYLGLEGMHKESYSLALADTLCRVCITAHLEDEEDFRERLRTMYLAFEEYKKAWNEIKNEC